MKRFALAAILMLLAAAPVSAAGEAEYLDGVLRAWQEGGKPPMGIVPGHMGGKKLLGYKFLNQIVARINGADAIVVNALCLFEGPNAPVPCRAVFRVTERKKDPALPDPPLDKRYRLSAAWQQPTGRYRPPASIPPRAPGPLTPAETATAAKSLAALRNPKLDLTQRNQKLDELAALGPAVVPAALRELRTADMERRRDLVDILARVNAPETPKLLREELANATTSCVRIVQRIQDDTMKAAEYRERAAKIPESTGGSYGGLKFPPEQTERASFLRLAAKFDASAADSRTELDACFEVLEVACADVARSTSAEDLAFLAGLVADKAAPLRATAWSSGVIDEGESSQAPAVGVSAHRSVSVEGQEQDWLPWGALWGVMRARIAGCRQREPLIALRDGLEKAFVPIEKKRPGAWQQACLVQEFQSAEGLLIERLAAADGPAPAGGKPVACTGEARDNVLAVLAPSVEKPGEDAFDKRRREGRYAEARRTAEMTTYQIALRYWPAAAAGAKLPAEPCFTTDAFDFFKERLPVTAFLDVREGAGEGVSRVALGTWQMPMRAALAADIEKGVRRVRLEVVARFKIGSAATRTIGNLSEIALPVEVDRVVLVDDATGETLSERK